MAVTKSRYWGFIVYPSSCVDNWKDILQESLLPIAISPLHDKDIDPDGKAKLPHYHILIAFGNTTTGTIANDLSSMVNGSKAIPVLSVKGMYRYHLHLDNPDKEPYDANDRILLNGFCIENYCQLSYFEMQQYKIAIIEFIEKEGIVEYRDLIYKLISYNIELFDFASSHTLLFNTYLCSRRNGLKALLDK